MNTIASSGKSEGLGQSMSNLWKRLLSRRREEPAVVRPTADAAPREWRRITEILHAATENKGEAHARERISKLLAFYIAANDADKRRLLIQLCEAFTVDQQLVRNSIQHYLEAADVPGRTRAEGKLLSSLESPRLRLLRHFNLLPDGVHALVSLRADMFKLARADEFLALDQDLLRLFTAWFDVGFLELKRIGWGSPASLLEKLIRYEAVHEIKSWNDLRNRLDSDRRCYAFFHGRMPEEPLIFVEVALVREVATSVQALLDETQPTLDPEQATTAIFYSISNAQSGLRGVSMGEFLIKRVVQQLLVEYPRLRNFATLSPIPGFGRWLEKHSLAADHETCLPADIKALLSQPGRSRHEALQQVLAQEIDGDQPAGRKLQEWLKSECAHYLLLEKVRGQPADAVARFHFSNGASLGRINWLADTSRHGRRQSCGLMVNYLYKLREIEENHDNYALDGSLASSSEIEKCLEAAVQRRHASRPKNQTQPQPQNNHASLRNMQ